MNVRFDSPGIIFNTSGINPFDRSYSDIQHQFDAAIMKLLSDVGNFTVNTIYAPLITNLESYDVSPNTWIIEQIVNGSSEISSVSMVLTPEMNYLAPYSFAVGTFRPQLFYRAKSVREKDNIYYTPFSSDVWIWLFSLVVIIIITLAFILGRETRLPHDTPYDLIAKIAEENHDANKEWRNDFEISSKESLLQREKWEIGEILLIAIGVLSQQGSARDPSTGAARTLLLVMFLLAVLVYTAYSASIFSLVSLLPSTDKELREISESLIPDSVVALQDTNFFRHNFQFHLSKVIHTDIDQGIDDAIKGKILFVGNQDECLTYINKKGYSAEDRCGLVRVFLGYKYQRVFAFKNDSNLKELINGNIIRLQQFGFMTREKKRLFDVSSPCNYKERSSISVFVSFNIHDVKPAIHLLIWGIGISVFFLLLEFLLFSSSQLFGKVFLRRLSKFRSKLRTVKGAGYASKNLKGKRNFNIPTQSDKRSERRSNDEKDSWTSP